MENDEAVLGSLVEFLKAVEKCGWDVWKLSELANEICCIDKTGIQEGV